MSFCVVSMINKNMYNVSVKDLQKKYNWQINVVRILN